MNAGLELWVRLKVVDLVAQTAWMTMIEKLGFAGDLKGLVRYSYWRMDVESSGRESILKEVDRVIRFDSAFTNQNKHLYRLLLQGGEDAPQAAPSMGDLQVENDYPISEEAAVERGERIFAIDCLIRERDGIRESGFRSRLNDRLSGVSVLSLKAGEVWRFIVSSDSLDGAKLKVEGIVVTRTRREGLLLNPHYQTFEILSASGRD